MESGNCQLILFYTFTEPHLFISLFYCRLYYSFIIGVDRLRLNVVQEAGSQKCRLNYFCQHRLNNTRGFFLFMYANVIAMTQVSHMQIMICNMQITLLTYIKRFLQRSNGISMFDPTHFRMPIKKTKKQTECLK